MKGPFLERFLQARKAAGLALRQKAAAAKQHVANNRVAYGIMGAGAGVAGGKAGWNAMRKRRACQDDEARRMLRTPR